MAQKDIQAHNPATNLSKKEKSRREFLTDLTVGFGAVGALAAAYPLARTLSPAANVEAQSTTIADLADLAPGQNKTVMWQGKPVFIKYRTADEIAEARAVDLNILDDPAPDEERVKNENYLVVLGICTHLGCVPMSGGNHEGWLCPCHGSQFDAAGRVRRGPAPTNLEVPPYEFMDDTTIRIG